MSAAAKKSTLKTVVKTTAKAVAKTTGKALTPMTARKKGATRMGAGPQSVERLLETGGTVTEDLRLIRFGGVSLGGGKTDKTAVAILEYFPDKKRVFLRSLRDRVSVKGELSADENLYTILTHEEHDLASIAFDAPLQLPKCVRCEVKCPGMDRCKEPEIKWMRDMHKKRDNPASSRSDI